MVVKYIQQITPIDLSEGYNCTMADVHSSFAEGPTPDSGEIKFRPLPSGVFLLKRMKHSSWKREVFRPPYMRFFALPDLFL
jgi:hypothetical protein